MILNFMNKYIILLLLLVSCGSRKVNKSDTTEAVKQLIETKMVDTSSTTINTDLNTRVLDTSSSSEIEITPLDTTKPFIYNNKVFKNAILRIKKHKNNISTQTTEKVSEKRHNAVTTTSKDKTQAKINVVKKDIDKKESLLSYWWILLLIAIGYIAYRVYDKNKFI